MKLTRTAFELALRTTLREAELARRAFAVVNSGELHARVGGYPGRSHAMPLCCSVMCDAMVQGDAVLAQPRKGNDAELTIKYALPR